MLRTFTLNPAVDVSLVVPELLPVHKNRASSASREAGGGGVNVARLLVRLGAEVECVVAVGGATGTEIVGALRELDVVISELDVEGVTRESVQIYDVHNDLDYRVTIEGPKLSDSIDHIVRSTQTGRVPDVNVFSGSLPRGCPSTIYADLSLVHPTAFTVVDTSGDALRGSLGGSVDVIKPSLRELEALVGHAIPGAEALERSVVELLDRWKSLGAVLVSLGAAGAVLGQRSEPLVHLIAPEVPVVSAVGAGDSVVAGIAWGASRGEDLLTSCRLGVAAGTATVATPGTSLCSAVSALNLLGGVEVNELRPDQTIR